MSKKKPPKYVPQFSPNYVVGYTFMHYALQAMSCAFLAGGK